MRPSIDIGKRLAIVREQTGLNSRQYSLSNQFDPSVYARIEKGTTGLPEPYLKTILDKYNVNSHWLLTGEGEIFTAKVSEEESSYGKSGLITRNPLLLPNNEKRGATEVPFYDADFVAGSSISFFEDNVDRPAYTMQIPGYAGCVAFPSYGDSMEKLIKGGSILFGRKLEDWRSYLEYGQIYGIVMKDSRRFLKYIRRADDKKKLLLRSENEKYDDFEVPHDKVHNIWLIEGWMLKRA